MGETAITNYAGTILKDQEYGRKWLKKLRDDPWSKNASEPMLKTYGEKLIRDAIDEQRRYWASKWEYFGKTAVETLGNVRHQRNRGRNMEIVFDCA